ncbi:MAG: class I SAM-dependent methyltransferase [Thermomicrobiaceae bacterium]
MVNSIEQLYAEYWGRNAGTAAELISTSLHPRDMDSLYDLFAQTGSAQGHLVLDIGCRDASHAIELARRFDCQVIGIDPVPHNIEIARELITNWDMDELVSAQPGQIESLDQPDSSVDQIWCRDMLNHVDLEIGLQECARVLKPGGWMMAYQTFGGEHLEAQEAKRMFAALSLVPENMLPAFFNLATEKAGFSVEVRDVIASEWREYGIENGDVTVATNLLEIARLRRAEEEIVSRIGRGHYEAELAIRQWTVYQLLGKLIPVAYLLRKK